MLRILAAAAAVALSVQAASASPFGASVSSGDADRPDRAGERQGVASFLMDRLAVIVVGKAAHAGDGSGQYQYYSDEECDAAKTAAEEAPKEEEEVKKAEPIGPEPIYYGF